MKLTLVTSIKAHEDYVQIFKFHPVDPIVAVSSVYRGAAVSLWNTETWECLLFQPVNKRSNCHFPKTNDTAYIYNDKSMYVVNWKEHDVQPRQVRNGEKLLFSNDAGTFIIHFTTGDRVVHVQVVHLLDGTIVVDTVLPWKDIAVQDISGEIVVFVQGNVITFWNAYRGEVVDVQRVPSPFPGVEITVMDVAIVYTASDERVCVWDVAAQQEYQCPELLDTYAVAKHPHEPVVCISEYDKRAHLWNYQTNEIVTVNGFGIYPCVAFDPAGNRLFVGDDTGTFFVYAYTGESAYT